jgi:hypothetical protein
MLAVPVFMSSSFPDRFALEKGLAGSPACGDPSGVAVFGGSGIPSPPNKAFIMVNFGWLHRAHHTDSRGKWMTDRNQNYNLNLSNCVS